MIRSVITILISMAVGALIGLGLMEIAIARDNSTPATQPTVTVCASTEATGMSCQTKP